MEIIIRCLESEEIMDIKVSVICNAYNHEAYIEDALKGFVMQKTTFPFEVLVHDDASTDRTAEIIRKYERQYPQIIKPIYSTENQYSKGDGSLERIQYGRAQGKYFAICEGDDYWTDPMKLQKQYDAMEQNPQVDMCAHQAWIYDCRAGKMVKEQPPVHETRILTAEEVILGGGALFATNSLFFRRSLQDSIPKFRRYLNFDYSLQIHGSLRGGVLFLNDNMSVYRFMTNGSWSQRVGGDREKATEHYHRVQRMFDILNEETGGKYDSAIVNKKKEITYNILAINKRYSIMLQPEYRKYFDAMPKMTRLKTIVKACLSDLAVVKCVFMKAK